MGDAHLRNLFDNMTPADRKVWYERKVLTARHIRASLLRLSGTTADTGGDSYAELPQANEIVGETVRRIFDRHNERYLWDGTTDFDKFFGACLKTTANSLRSSERNHRRGQDKLNPALDIFYAAPIPDYREVAELNDNAIAEKQSAQVLAGAIARTRMTGTVKTYAARLASYAETRLTTEEIARDLGVSPGSIDPYRHRIRNALKKPPE